MNEERLRSGAGRESASLADDLQRLRLRSGVTLRDLERKTGFPRSTLHDALSGRRFPRLDTLLAVVTVCGGDSDIWRARWMELRSQHLDEPPASPAPPAADAAGQRQLPRAVSDFTGRAAELAELDAVLDRAAEGSAVVVITGMPGVGKTALALYWANRAQAWFPDGQLFVDLRGYGPGPAVSRSDAVLHLLRSCGLSTADIPVTDGERTAMLRSLLVGRRVLLLLDNVAHPEALDSLLPGEGGCLAPVTSRSRPAGLLGDGAYEVRLSPLPEPDSEALLGTLLAERMPDEEDALAVLSDVCGQLPLAVRVAAETLRRRPWSSLSEHAGQMRRGPLAELSLDLVGDWTLRARLAASYERLAPEVREMFLATGLQPDTYFSTSAAAAVAGTEPAQARTLLAVLCGLSLLDEVSPDRYRVHPLVREFGHELAAEQLSYEERLVALTRLVDHRMHEVGDAAARAATLP